MKRKRGLKTERREVVSYKELSDKLERLKNPKESIVIFGCGKLFRENYDLFLEYKVNIVCICDNDVTLQGSTFEGIDIVSFQEAIQLAPEGVFVHACHDALERQLEESQVGVFYPIWISVFYLNNRDLKSYYFGTALNLWKEKISSPNCLSVPSVDIYITDRCSLHCRDCSNLMPYFKNPKDYDYETVTREIDIVCDTFDEILELRLLGGEPFVHPLVYEFALYASQKENVRFVNLISNGTIPLQEKKLEQLDLKKTIFALSDYGELSRAMKENLNLLNKLKFHFSYRENLEWFDCIGFEYQNYNPEMLRKVFDTCCTKNARAYSCGKFYLCSYAASLDKLKAIPKSGISCIEFDQYPDKASLKEALMEYLEEKEWISTCQYCKGRSFELNPTVKAAIQAKGCLEYDSME